MENLFLKYMAERSGSNKDLVQVKKSEGPVITISREYGCPAKRIAEKLTQTLTSKNARMGINKEWRWISKEIIEESAKELKLTPSLTKDLSDYKQTSFFENLALFFSEDFYPGDAKIKNTIAKFIHTAAEEGNVIIVGRAAEAITKKISQSLHIKLHAPLKWRIEKIAKKEGISISEATKICTENDARRKQFRDYFEKGQEDSEFFDITLNCKTTTDDEIIEILVILAETRGFVL